MWVRRAVVASALGATLGLGKRVSMLDEEEKDEHAPIVFVPGLACTALEIQHPEIEVFNPFKNIKETCKSNKPGYGALWLSVKLGRKDKPCWYHQLTMGHEQDGSIVQPLYGEKIGFVEPNLYIHKGIGAKKDKHGSALFKSNSRIPGTKYFIGAVERLEQEHGFKAMRSGPSTDAGVNDGDFTSRLEDPWSRLEQPDLYSAAYDFRRGDKEFVERFHTNLQELVERAYYSMAGSVRNGRSCKELLQEFPNLKCGRKVLMVGHSLGANQLGWFLRHMAGSNPAWLNTFVGGGVFVGGAFGGSAKILQSLIMGDDLGMPSMFSSSMLRSALQTMTTSYWLSEAGHENVATVDEASGVATAVPPEEFAELVKSALETDEELDRSNPMVLEWLKNHTSKIDRAFRDARANYGFPHSFLDNAWCRDGNSEEKRKAEQTYGDGWVSKALCAIPQIPQYFMYATGAETASSFALAQSSSTNKPIVPSVKETKKCKLPLEETLKALFGPTGKAGPSSGRLADRNFRNGLDDKKKKCFANFVSGPFGDSTVSSRSALLPYAQWAGQTGSGNPFCKIHRPCLDDSDNACHRNLVMADTTSNDYIATIAKAVYARQHGQHESWPKDGGDVSCFASGGRDKLKADQIAETELDMKRLTSKSTKVQCCMCQFGEKDSLTKCKTQSKRGTALKCSKVCQWRGVDSVGENAEPHHCAEVFPKLKLCNDALTDHGYQ